MMTIRNERADFNPEFSPDHAECSRESAAAPRSTITAGVGLQRNEAVELRFRGFALTAMRRWTERAEPHKITH